MPLRTSLLLNAVFSVGTGLLLALAPNTVGGWLGVEIDGWLRLLGLALLGHAIALIWASRHASIRSWAQLNLAAIAPYPLILLALIGTGLVDTSLGRTLLLLDAATVGALAATQWFGLRTETPEVQPVAP